MEFLVCVKKRKYTKRISNEERSRINKENARGPQGPRVKKISDLSEEERKQRERDGWRIIEGFPRYEVHRSGKIRNGNGYVLSPGDDGRGYDIVSLWKNKKGKTMSVHRIVARAFLEGDGDGLDVNHINCIKKDNRVENLEWCTRKENIRHGMRNGDFDQKGSYNNSAKLTEEDVLKIRKMKCGTRKMAELFGVSMSTVQKIRKRETWKHL